MHESSLKFLRCPRCSSGLDLAVLKQNAEVDEGFLECDRCNLQFPIVDKIPIMWDDFMIYLSERTILGGRLFQMASHPSMRKFLKSCLLQKSKAVGDRTFPEERWSTIYQNSRRSRFYSIVKRDLDSLPSPAIALEYGPSIGIMTRHLSETCNCIFGIDKSFNALSFAKKSQKPNVDYFVADFLSPIFNGTKFDLVLALNVLELVEPAALLRQISTQVSKGGSLVLSDPYDFDRGENSVKDPLDPATLRSKLRKLGFFISGRTKDPSYLPWNLKINSRASLIYKVDLVISRLR